MIGITSSELEIKIRMEGINGRKVTDRNRSRNSDYLEVKSLLPQIITDLGRRKRPGC